MARYQLQAGDIVVADRAYGTVSGMEYARKAGAGFVLRLRTSAFALYDETGGRIDLLPRLNRLRTWERTDFSCFYQDARGEKHPVRIVVSRKDGGAHEKAVKRLTRASLNKHGKAPSPTAVAMNEYIVLATNLQDTREQVLELYRARWQIEQVFHRLKGLFPGSTHE